MSKAGKQIIKAAKEALEMVLSGEFDPPLRSDLKSRLAIPCFEKGLDEGWIDAERLEALARIEALERELDALQSGETVVLPTSQAHANAMSLVASAYGKDRHE